MGTVVIIWVGGLILIFMAVVRIIAGVFDVDSTLMLIVAILCIIIDIGYGTISHKKFVRNLLNLRNVK